MSAGAWVLAVMDKYLNYVLPGKLWDGNNSYCNQPGREGSEYSADMAKLAEARAAVAELIAERDERREAEADAFHDGVILALQVMASTGDTGSAQYEELLNAADALAVYKRAEAEEMLELSGLADFVKWPLHKPSCELRAAIAACKGGAA